MEIEFKLKWRQVDGVDGSAPDDAGVTSYYLNCGNIVIGSIDVIDITKNLCVCGNSARFDVEWYDAFYRGDDKERVTAISSKTLEFIASRIERQALLYLEQLCHNTGQLVTVNCSGHEIVKLPEPG